MKFRTTRGKPLVQATAAAFTLAEVLAALMFMAIVIPVAVEALHIASVAGEIAVRKAEAARVATNILNETVVSANDQQAAGGTMLQNGHEYQWSLSREVWQADSGMQLLTVDVSFFAQGRKYTVRLSTLENPSTSGLMPGSL